MAALCGPGCGYCGRCTAAWEREDDDRALDYCDTCGNDAGPAAIILTTGLFCSAQCADVASNLQIQTAAVL